MKYNKIYRTAICGGILTAALLAITANASEVTPTFAVSGERIEQSFDFGVDESDATIGTITLAPGFAWGDWHVSASLPWQSIDGEYFFNNLYPNLAQTCNRINQLTPLQKFLLVRNTQLTQESLDYCAETGGVESASVEDSISGWNDIEIFANYFIPAGSTWLAGSVGFGYQHDNGDEYEGLGNGARQLFTETTWMASSRLLSLSATLGYYFIVEDNSAIGLKDHGYGSLDGRLYLGEHVELGISYFYQQTDNDVFDDYDYLTYSSTFILGKHWSARLFISDYQNEPGLPDEEFGGSILYML
ncbi:MAG: hypothetical protein D9N11_13500 [Ketobacter sp.]|nr:MAG: hypothetical protein D9N11_13500 [Ketobacter sp.]